MRERRIAVGLERFFAPQPMAAVVVARIVLGSILFVSYASKLPYVQSLYGPEGLGGVRLHERVGGIAAGRALESSAQWLHVVASPGTIWILYAALLFASLAFAVGAFTRTSGCVALVLHALFHAHTFTATLGWAVLLKSFLVCVIFAHSGAFGSVDAWRRRNRDRDGTAARPVAAWRGPGWPVRLLQMQVCAMYAVNWLRAADPGWSNGSMVFKAVQDRWYGRLDVDWFDVLPVLVALSFASLLLELLAPVMLWVRGVGKWWALGLIGLHANLELFANVGWWQPMMMVALLTFLPVAWVAPLLTGPRWVFARRRATAAVTG